MSFIQDIYEHKEVFNDIEKLSLKCVHSKCDIDVICYCKTWNTWQDDINEVRIKFY